MELSTLRSVVVELWRMTFHRRAWLASGDLASAAYELAESEVDDETAVEELRNLAGEKPDRATDRAIKHWLPTMAGMRETGRARDRAYRLMQAVATGTPVEPVDPARMELFRRVDEIDAMPIGDAYSWLAARVPQLSEFAEDVEPYPEGELELQWKAEWEWTRRQWERLSPFVGPDASSPDPLMRASQMRALATDYLSILAGNRSLGTTGTPHREIREREEQEMRAARARRRQQRVSETGLRTDSGW